MADRGRIIALAFPFEAVLIEVRTHKVDPRNGIPRGDPHAVFEREVMASDTE